MDVVDGSPDRRVRNTAFQIRLRISVSTDFKRSVRARTIRTKIRQPTESVASGERRDCGRGSGWVVGRGQKLDGLVAHARTGERSRHESTYVRCDPGAKLAQICIYPFSVRAIIAVVDRCVPGARASHKGLLRAHADVIINLGGHKYRHGEEYNLD